MSFFLVSQLSSPITREEGVPGHIGKNKTKLNIHKLSPGQITLPVEFLFFFFGQDPYPVIVLYIDRSVNPQEREL